MKEVFTSLYNFSSALNFSSWKNSKISSIGRKRYTPPIHAHRIDCHPAPSLICASKMISPIALKRRVASTSFIARMLSSPLTLSLMLDRRSRVSLSTQQKKTSPSRVRTHPMGTTEQQRQVNHTDSISSAYFLPMLYRGFSMRTWASCCVRSVLSFIHHRLASLCRYHGLTSQMMGTRKALKKNIMDYSSTTPNSYLQMLFKAKSSTKRVIMAVVKKRPKVYFKPKENQYSLPVRCFSISVKRCSTKERQNLLKKIMASMARMVAAVARCSRSIAAGSSGWALSSLNAYSTACPLAVRMPQKTPVTAPMKITVRVQPMTSLPIRFSAGQLMFSQMISLGYGASSILISSPPSPKNSFNFSFSTLSHFSRKSFLASSLSITMMAFSQTALSLLINSTCLSCSFSSRPLILASQRSIASSCSVRSSPSGLRSQACFSRIAALFSSLMRQQSSKWFNRISSSTTQGTSPAPARMNSCIRPPVPALQGRLVMMIEQSDSEVVRSSQYSLVFLMVSRMQSSAMKWMRKEDSLSTTSSLVTTVSVRMKRISQLVHCPSTPPGSSRICPSRQISTELSKAQVMERAEQVTSCSVSRIIAYFVKMKQSGKPKPRNYSYFEFSHRGIGYLCTMFKQHSQRL